LPPSFGLALSRRRNRNRPSGVTPGGAKSSARARTTVGGNGLVHVGAQRSAHVYVAPLTPLLASTSRRRTSALTLVWVKLGFARPHVSHSNMRFQSAFILMIPQPFFFASS